MAKTEIRWADKHLEQYADLLIQVNRENPIALPRIINGVGNKAKTAVILSLRHQTGLPRRTIVKAIGNPATARANGRLSYEMVTRGGFIRLKYLEPIERRAGVVAKPFGKKQLYPGSFIKGGRFPKRVPVAQFGGHVFHRLNKAGDKITQTRSEVRIPQEMTIGATKSAFERTAGPLLRERVEKYLAGRFKA